MKKLLPVLFFIFFVSSFAPGNIYAASITKTTTTTVSARIGQFTLDLSGIIAPYASVTLISGENVLRSTVADANGYFTISQVFINKGFSNFCLDAIDFRRLGESYTCFTIVPATDNVNMKNIFLPPTLGLERAEITVGDVAIAWGYSMPGATVTLHSSDGKTYTVTADSKGYYEIHLHVNAPGTYELFADANYQKQQSLVPARKTRLLALSIAEQAQSVAKTIEKQIEKVILGNPWWLLLLILPVIILIIILLKKLSPRWFTSIEAFPGKLFAHVPFISHKLHHAWFVGY